MGQTPHLTLLNLAGRARPCCGRPGRTSFQICDYAVLVQFPRSCRAPVLLSRLRVKPLGLKLSLRSRSYLAPGEAPRTLAPELLCGCSRYSLPYLIAAQPGRCWRIQRPSRTYADERCLACEVRSCSDLSCRCLDHDQCGCGRTGISLHRCRPGRPCRSIQDLVARGAPRVQPHYHETRPWRNHEGRIVKYPLGALTIIWCSG